MRRLLRRVDRKVRRPARQKKLVDPGYENGTRRLTSSSSDSTDVGRQSGKGGGDGRQSGKGGESGRGR